MKKTLFTGAVMMALAVLLGAFGAHALKAILTPAMLITYNTGVEYQFYHAIGLLVIGLTGYHVHSKWLSRASGLIVAGIILFSGSLYVLTLTGIKGVGIITPFGGVAFVAGWLCMALALWKR